MNYKSCTARRTSGPGTLGKATGKCDTYSASTFPFVRGQTNPYLFQLAYTSRTAAKGVEYGPRSQRQDRSEKSAPTFDNSGIIASTSTVKRVQCSTRFIYNTHARLAGRSFRKKNTHIDCRVSIVLIASLRSTAKRVQCAHASTQSAPSLSRGKALRKQQQQAINQNNKHDCVLHTATNADTTWGASDRTNERTDGQAGRQTDR